MSDLYTLAGIVDQYLVLRQISKKKYFSGYLLSARYVWKELFKNTIYSTQSEWMELKECSPYNYVNIPKEIVRIFSVAEVDHCGNIEMLFYNNELNVIPKPKQSSCGCNDSCGCDGGLCDDLNSLTKTTKLLFSVSGIDYYETDWIKVCPNGDVIEYREVPTKKFNNFTGDGGDFNNDFNNDYLIANPPFSDYEIVTEIFQSVICKLSLKPCGCPENTPQNEEIFFNQCGCFLRCDSKRRRKHSEHILGDTNNNHRGEVKVSDCGTRIYYKPHHNRHTSENKLPTHLLVNYQTSGEDCTNAVIIPDYAIVCMFAGIDHYSKQFNNMYNLSEKQQAKYNFIDEQNKIIIFLNPLNLEILSNVQDQRKVW